MKTRTWKFLVEHSCSRSESFTQAVKAFNDLKETSSMTIDVGPLADDESPKLVRVHVLGQVVIVGVVFFDRQLLVQITAPATLAWTEAVVKAPITAMVEKLLRDAGSAFVEIRQY